MLGPASEPSRTPGGVQEDPASEKVDSGCHMEKPEGMLNLRKLWKSYKKKGRGGRNAKDESKNDFSTLGVHLN